MTNEIWSIITCLVIPIVVGAFLITILLFGWRRVTDVIGKTFIDWINKK